MLCGGQVVAVEDADAVAFRALKVGLARLNPFS
jgi:hypothetical protein